MRAQKSIKKNKQDDAHGCASVAGGRTPRATVREFAAQQGMSEQEALAKGLEEKSIEFKKTGSEIYHEV